MTFPEQALSRNLPDSLQTLTFGIPLARVQPETSDAVAMWRLTLRYYARLTSIGRCPVCFNCLHVQVACILTDSDVCVGLVVTATNMRGESARRVLQKPMASVALLLCMLCARLARVYELHRTEQFRLPSPSWNMTKGNYPVICLRRSRRPLTPMPAKQTKKVMALSKV